MAAIASDRVTVVFDEGSAQRWVGYKIVNFGTADTLDVSTRFAGTVEVAAFLVAQSTTVGTVTSTTAAVLTLTLAGTTAASGYLLARGQRSS